MNKLVIWIIVSVAALLLGFAVFYLNAAGIFTTTEWAMLFDYVRATSVYLWMMGTAIYNATPLEWRIAIGVAIGILVLMLILRGTRGVHRSSVKRHTKIRDGERVGWWLSPIETNFVWRPILSLLVGQSISWLLYGLAYLIGSSIFPWWGAATLGVLLGILFALNDALVPVSKAHVAIVTFFGLRLRIYLEEGDHYWYGGKFGFGYSSEPLPKALEGSPEKVKGFVFVGDRVIDIWASREEDSNDPSLLLESVASDMSTITNRLTITVKTEDPLQWANSDNPVLDVAERSRSAFRTLVSFFTGPDNLAMKSVASSLMRGQRIVTAFTDRAVGIHPKGSVIQNRSGERIFEIIDAAPSQEGVRDIAFERAAAQLTKRINNEADTEMKAAVLNSARIPYMQSREVTDHLLTATDKIGAYFDHASVSHAKASAIVETAANKASAENQDRVGQVLSAKTNKEVRDILREDMDKPGSEMATMLAAAKDGHAKVIYVPGGDRLTKAAAVHSATSGGK